MARPDLTPGEAAAVDAITSSTIRATEVVWERPHVVRASLADGRSVIVKRPRLPDGGGAPTAAAVAALETERATLQLLAEVAHSPAPVFLGADTDLHVVVMEDLPPGRALADLLLADDPDDAAEAVVAYAGALARLHAATAGLEGRYDELRDRVGARSQPWWADTVDAGRPGIGELAEAMAPHVDVAALDDECGDVAASLRADGWWRTIVHGDPCPDNTRIETGPDGRFRVFDYERSSFGSCLLDASYVVAPFPTCWCFARLPTSVADRAVTAYRSTLATTIPEAGDDGAWDDALVVALAAWIVARGAVIVRLLDGDRVWGTAGMRPRILRWIDAFIPVAQQTGRFPALLELATTLRPMVATAWPDATIAAYPAFAGPDEIAVMPPEFWRPGL